MTTGIWVAVIGAGIAVTGWVSMQVDTILGAATLGFGAAHVMLGLLDAAFARRSARAIGAILDDDE